DVTAGDIAPDATKSGMLGSVAVIEAVAEAIQQNNLQPYVCDPVMVAKSGDKLLKNDAVGAIARKLFPLATVITPNLRETAVLTGVERIEPIVSVGRDAARRLIDLGAKAAVIKGFEQGDQMVDLFFDGRDFLEFADKLQSSEKTHGSGCA